MKSGRNDVYLAKMGFQVEGVDMSTDAVEYALFLARSQGVHICARVEDMERIPRFEEDSYDLVVCFNYLQRSLISQLKNWVKTNGMVVYGLGLGQIMISN